jgi:PST family polysaccharide transporter
MQFAEPQSFSDVRRRSLAGYLALVLRGGAGKAVSLAALILLSRLLAPEHFGLFAIIQFPISLLSLFADAGLHAALVQRQTLDPADEAAGFTLRLLLALALAALAAIFAGPLAALYRLPPEGVWALRALALGPLLNALGTVPGVRLTRALRFDRLAWAEFGSLLASQAASVLLALAGAGLWSLVLGALIGASAGTVLVNLLAPWRPRLRLAAASARGLLRFGLPYQSQGLLHLAKDRVIPALGGLFLGSGPVGLLAWAQDLARWPRLPADYAARIGFPAFARLQSPHLPRPNPARRTGRPPAPARLRPRPCRPRPAPFRPLGLAHLAPLRCRAFPLAALPP